jgi:hypothetical protein
MSNYIDIIDISSLGHNISLFTNEELNNIISLASFLADEYCGQSLGSVNEVDEMFSDINNFKSRFEIYPKYLPIISVEKIELINQSNIFSELNSDDYIIDNTRGCIQVFTQTQAFLGRISYTHGYTIIPEGIKQGTILIAKSLMDQLMSTKLTGFSDTMQIQEYQEKIIRQIPNINYYFKKFRRAR